jgi:hypothetical protein
LLISGDTPMQSVAHPTLGDVAPLALPSDGSRARSAEMESARLRIVAAAVCALLIALPFLAVQFPPVTDLPQQVAQIRLFLAALGDPDGPYRIQWLTPYSASYLLLGAAWALCTPANAGRFAVLGLGLLWIVAVHGLAARRRRSVAAAVLASILFFNHTVYWGFLSFGVGALAFVVWFLVSTRAPSDRWSWRDGLAQFGAGLLLYVSHVLWFGVGVAWLVLYGLAHRWPPRLMLARLASVAPIIVGAALWYPHLAALGFVSPTIWFTPPLARLSPEWLVDSVLGGFYGPAEPLVALILLAWVVGGVVQQRGAWRARVDADLVCTGLGLVALALVLPDEHMNTIQFAARWLPMGTVLIVLGVPPPALLVPWQRQLAVAVLAVFSVATTVTWQRFERDELSGLPAALAALPDGQRVIGLDLVQESPVIKGRPFLQTFAYAQVLRGGSLNASFAGFAPSLVVYRERRPVPWTLNLEWFAARVRPQDVTYFDYALINGRPDTHGQALAFPLAAVTDTGRWRLYRVTAPRS